MRVLLVADASSIHTQRWASSLAARGHEVHVATFRHARVEAATVHVLRTFGLGKAGYLLAIPPLRSLARRIRPDVIHAHYVTSYGFVAAMSGIRPLMVTAWGSDVLFDPSERRGAAWLGRAALRRADQVTTVAEHMNQPTLRLAARELELVSIPFGVDTDVFRYMPGAPGDDVLRIVCTRNFHPLYDVESVVRAVATVSGALDTTLTLVGEGPERATLEKLTRDLNIADRVRFCGHISPLKLAEELAAANVFVTPSHADGNNVSLNEAMAVGCFPIATDIPANRQWIEDGRNGLLYPAGDAAALASAIRRAWDDPSLRSHSAVLNRAIVDERAAWSNCVDVTVGLYRVMEHGTVEHR